MLAHLMFGNPRKNMTILSRPVPFISSILQAARSFQPTETGTGVRRGTPLEGIEILCHVFRLDTDFGHPLLEQRSVVYTLSSREDLFSSHEEVV
jgi:hypothetical protein